MESLEMTLRSSAIGRAMLLTSTLMNVKNQNVFKKSSDSTPNSSPPSFTKLSGFNAHAILALRSLQPRFTLHDCHLACRDLQRDIAHSSCCDSSVMDLSKRSPNPPVSENWS